MQFVEFLGLGMFPFCTFVIGVYKELYGFVWLHIDLYGSVRICMYLYCLILMYRYMDLCDLLGVLTLYISCVLLCYTRL